MCITSDNAKNVLNSVALMDLGCFAHTMNLAVEGLLKIDFIDKVVKKVKSIQSTISHSYKLKIALKNTLKDHNKTQKNIPAACPTRWWSTLHMLEVFREQSLEITQVLRNSPNKNAYKLFLISEKEREFIDILIESLKPLERVSQHLSGEKYITSSVILPVIKNLKDEMIIVEDDEDDEEQLDLMVLKNKIISIYGNNENLDDSEIGTFMKKHMSVNLSNRYEHCKDFFDKITFFDPRLKDNSTIAYGDILDDITELGTVIDDNLTESNASNNRGLTSLIKRKRAGQEEDPARREFEKYKQLQEIDISEDPLQWWKENEKRYPRFAKLAKKFLCIPATSVPSERMFSCSGNVITDKRTCLSGDHAEQLTFLHMNSDFVHI